MDKPRSLRLFASGVDADSAQERFMGNEALLEHFLGLLLH